LALGAISLWFLLLVTGQRSLSMHEHGLTLFIAIGILALLFSACAGIFLTADCVSEEKRDGTLGLLFLTDLSSLDVVLGKLSASSLNACYGLLTVLPVLALPLLMGGITGSEFWRVVLVLVTTLAFSLALGLLMSVRGLEAKQTMVNTLLILVFLTGILPLLYWIPRWVFRTQPWSFLMWPSPAYLYQCAFEMNFRGANGPREFWASWLTIGTLTLAALAGCCLGLPRAWRRAGNEELSASRSAVKQESRLNRARSKRRRSILGSDPFYWLASRGPKHQSVCWKILTPLFGLWALCLIACASRSWQGKDALFAICIFLAYGMHQIFKFLLATEATRRFSEDRRSGAFELLRVTPLTGKDLLTGQWRALKRRFAGPMLLMLPTNVGLLWLIRSSSAMHMSGSDAMVFTELFVGGAVALVLDFYTLAWVGMWSAFSAPNHPKAILHTLGRVMLVPWLVILILVFLGMGGWLRGANQAATIFAFWFLFGILLDLFLVAKAKATLNRLLCDRPALKAGARGRSRWRWFLGGR
jgi:ABC-type multidrug transport system permease subunit